ncbi:hypothetical protein BH23CHL2_BH23CHL2_28990 [soil metagenome]
MNAQPDESTPPDDDPRRIQAALGYLFTPVVPLLNMTGDASSDPWVRRHAVQSLIWSGPFVLLLVATVLLVVILINSNFLFICLMPVLLLVPFAPGALWARRIYLGGEVSIPIIADRIQR